MFDKDRDVVYELNGRKIICLIGNNNTNNSKKQNSGK